MELKGKVCIVTGGGSGIGKSLSQQIASEGGKVSIFDLDPKTGEELAEALNEKYGNDTAIFCKCDVTNMVVFRECFEKTKQKFGSIQVVINNAGIWNDSPSAWSREIDINLKGVVNGCLLGLEYMGARGGGVGGSIVNTASMLGLSTNSLMPIYSATKAAVIALTKCFGTALNFELNRVRFMVVCPNATVTHLFADVENHFYTPAQELVAEFEKLQKVVKFQSPDNVARCAVRALKSQENGSVWVSEFDQPGLKLEIDDLPLDGLKETRIGFRVVG